MVCGLLVGQRCLVFQTGQPGGSQVSDAEQRPEASERVDIAWVVRFQITSSLTNLGFHSEGNTGLMHNATRGS